MSGQYLRSAEVWRRSPDASTASLPAIRELAAVVLVLVKAVEAVVDVLGHQRVQAALATTWARLPEQLRVRRGTAMTARKNGLRTVTRREGPG